MSKKMLALFAGIFALLALGASIAIPYRILSAATGDLANFRVPLLALAGFLGVFACVALLVLSFKVMDLTDGKQALGMPEGSVRALIAIFLVVILGMAALFLLGPRSAGKIKPDEEPTQGTEAQGTEMLQGTESPQGTEVAPAAMMPSGSLEIRKAAVKTPPARSGGTAPPPSSGAARSRAGGSPKPNSGPIGNPAKNETTATAANQDGDLAKQFLTLVGGLVTTVVGFYFGSQTANSSAAKGARAAADAAASAATQATSDTIRALRP